MKSNALVSILLLCLMFTCFIFLIPAIYDRARLELTGIGGNTASVMLQATDSQAGENTSFALVSKLKRYIDLFEVFSTGKLTENEVVRKAIGVLSHIKYSVNGTVNAANVLSGKDDWLFYQIKDSTNDPLADFAGTNHLTEDEMAYCLQLTQAVSDYFSKKNIKFVLMIPPNKERVYSEKMPDHIQKGDVSKVDVLADYFWNNAEISLVYPYKALINAKSKYQVYYKYDTHWNRLGAYIGEQELLKEMGYSTVDLSKQTITSTKEFENDLAKMVDLTQLFINNNEYIINGINIAEKNELFTESVNINANAPYDKSILFIGDSFRTAMLSYLQADFYKVTHTHRENDIDGDLFERAAPDVVVWEMVERYVTVEAFETMANKLITE